MRNISREEEQNIIDIRQAVDISIVLLQEQSSDEYNGHISWLLDQIDEKAKALDKSLTGNN